MADTDGSVAIEIKMDVDDAEKELESLKGKVRKLETELSEKKYTKSALEKQLEKAEKAYIEIYNSTKGDLRTEEEVQAILQAEAHVENLKKKLEKVNDDILTGNIALDATKNRYGEVAQEAERLRQAEEGGQEEDSEEDEAALSKGQMIKQRLKEFGASVKEELSYAASAGLSALIAGLKKIPGLLKSAFSKGLQFVKAFGKGLLGVVKNLNVFSKISGKLGPSLSRLGTMVKQAFVFGVVTKGLNYVREQMSGLISKNTEFMEALGRLKGVLLTAFQPVYEYIMPALTALVNGLTRALAVVAQFVAALFGKTAAQAQESAKALNTESESLEETGEAADEAAGSLAGFDEINTIQTENKKSGGEAGQVDSGSPTFDYVFGDGNILPFDSWGEAFDAFLGKLLAGIPRLKSAFSAFASSLNSFSKKVLDMFTFPGVKQKVMALGNELAGALNDLVQNINWNQLGQALGAGLNLALLFLANFLYTLDWLSLGNSLAAAFNGLVSQIDWGAFGRLLWSGFKIGIETLAGFILGLDMPQMAEAASNIVINFFNSALGTITSIDWSAIGTQISTFLTKIDWVNVFSSIGGFTTGVVTGLTIIISSVDWVSIATSILDGLLSVDWSALFGSLGDLIGTTLTTILDLLFSGEIWDKMFDLAGEIIEGLWEGITNALSDVYGWLKKHVFKPIIDGFKRLFGIHSPSTVMAEQGGLLMDGIKQGITNKIAAVVATFKGLWEKIKGVFSNITEWFRSKFSAAWQAVKNVFSTGGKIFDGIKDGILSGLKTIINAIINGINKVIAIPFNGLNSALSKIKNISILGLKPFSWINTISVPQIPKLAQGAVIPPNREFMAVLGDQRSGTNVEAPLETIKQALMEALRDSGGSNRPINITMMLDRKVIGKAAISEIRDNITINGKLPFPV